MRVNRFSYSEREGEIILQLNHLHPFYNITQKVGLLGCVSLIQHKTELIKTIFSFIKKYASKEN